VHQIFEQGPPSICLQDVRIPKRGKRNVKRELQRIFPHYWICIITAQSPRTNSKDWPYVFLVLTALHSAFLPKVTQVQCQNRRQMKPEIRMELDGRLSILLGRTPTGETFQFITYTNSPPQTPRVKLKCGIRRKIG